MEVVFASSFTPYLIFTRVHDPASVFAEILFCHSQTPRTLDLPPSPSSSRLPALLCQNHPEKPPKFPTVNSNSPPSSTPNFIPKHSNSPLNPNHSPSSPPSIPSSDDHHHSLKSMDTIVHAALEEICSQGVNGVSLSLLWPRLHSSLSSSGVHLCPAVKRAVWSGLVAVPGLQFRDINGLELPDPKSKTVEECESLDVKVVANEQLRRCFVGLYDVKASNITAPQQRVLERLALARETGVIQNQLCKELGIAANNFFYVAKRLESWGLIVRQEIIVRTKEASSDKEPKNSQPVLTKLIRLHRYALPLSSQQRLEITKENKNLEENLGENVSGADLEECGQDDVHVRDFLPAIKAVCDRLEKAEGKVLVVSDIKQELGYRETKGHRDWRNICNRLKQAGLVEEFEAKVDSKVEAPTKSKKSRSRGQNKPVSCLRLLKNFSPKCFQQKNRDGEYDNFISEHPITPGNQVQQTEQLVELPFEQQIYDMIDIEGSKGVLGVDVCKRLGISTKMFDNLTNTMVSRFGLHQLSENCKKGLAYRFWTKGNFCPELPNSSFNRLQDGPDGHPLALALSQEPTHGTSSQRTTADMDSLNSQKWLNGENMEKIDTEEELEHESQQVRGSVQIVACPRDSPGLALDMSNIVPGSASGYECNGTTEAAANSVSNPFKLQEGQRYPSLTSAQREIRLLERLKTEKIIVKPELHRWLESFEKDKKTRMDRKTLTHCLNKLELEGKCKLMVFSIPGVSNCGQLREILVVLHPSVQGSASELSDQVHDRLRSFEMQSRGALSQSKKELPIPVLHGIERIQISAHSDTQSAKSEVMRANGFVLAKMVRTKLLHRFLWDYVNNSAACTEMSTSINSVNPTRNSSCLLFGLDVAIKAMPFELFLQVVGSPLKWTDMIEKCKTGLLLSDLPDEEYKSMMDTRATGRLSWLIDILRRLKLIRLVADESPTDATKISHAKLIYALELKPYIEEPTSMDLLPRGLRHDFVLSTGEAVEKYWQTLEFCYAAADPKAAVRAFPGSVVFEVCLYRSWTTVRVMKAEQRAELLKRIKDQQSKKLSFQECREIAKDLNLSLEQVLRVYYDNRQQRLNRFQGDSNIQGVVSDARSDRHPQSRRKRKVSAEERLAKCAKANHTSESHEDSEEENFEEPEGFEHEEQQESLIGQRIMPILKPTRQQKFSWTEEADRHLLIQYARQRAIQGARRGTDWASISDLPAPPNTCRRRVSVLRRDIKLKNSLMRLCNLLTQRYAQQLDQEKNECDQESHSQRKRWDDFDDCTIKVALNEVLVQKQMMKLESAKRSESASQGAHNIVTSSPGEFDNDSEKQQIGSSQRSRRHRLPQKFVMHLKEGVSITKRMNQSLAVSCAVELFKLVFLTNSKAAEMPNLLAETLCCYSEHDLFSAFDCLRQKKFLVGSGPSQPFVLSQNFLRSLSLSQFPANTGKRAAKLARWICEKEKKLMEGVVDLPSDLQCGDVFHLFALISSGELSIMPVLPLEGVGEAEDSRSAKRKYDDHEFEDSGVSKKHKCNSLQEGEIFSRREKGFPGIKVSLSRATILRSSTVEFFKDEDNSMLFSENDQFYTTLGRKVSCTLSSIESVKESPDFGSIIPATIISGNSLWEVMTNYIIQDLSKHSGQEYAQLHPELFKIAHTNIQKAGDQGLTMSKVSECLGIQGTILAEHVVNVLQLFGLVLKVNGYNSVHVVDGQYRTKYFLASKTTCSQDPGMASSSVPQRDETHIVEGTPDCEDEVNYSDNCEVHSLNPSEEVSPLSNIVQAHKKLEGCSSRASTEERENVQNFDNSTATFRPILPWINGDGTINGIVYRGLTRRILGIVTQNPAILEDDILSQMEVLNSQSCRKLLESMVLDKHLIVRKMTQRTSSTPPALLERLIGSHSRPNFVCQQHYFANPMSTSLL